MPFELFHEEKLEDVVFCSRKCAEDYCVVNELSFGRIENIMPDDVDDRYGEGVGCDQCKKQVVSHAD